MLQQERLPPRTVALVTGGNSGIGKITARELAARGAHVFVACRSHESAEAALTEIRAAVPNAQIENIPLDLGDFLSIRACANEFLSRGLPLQILVNNAGIVPGHGSLSKSGFELAFGVNHLGHFLLTQLLLGRLRESAPSRIVTVASDAHRGAPGLDWDALRNPTHSRTGFPEYSVSKLANILFSAELARRIDGSRVNTYALHPGVVATNVWRRVPPPIRGLMKLFMLSTERGAQTTLHYAMSDKAARESGLYYDRLQPATPSALAQDTALATELWQRSEEWTRDASQSPLQP